MTKTTMTKIGVGFYQISNGIQFSNLHKDRDTGKWTADIRESLTGNLVRYAGIWNTLKEAREEAEFIMATPAERQEFLEAM